MFHKDALHHALVGGFPDALLLTTQNGNLLEANALAREMFGAEIGAGGESSSIFDWFADHHQLQALVEQARGCSSWVPARLVRRHTSEKIRVDLQLVRMDPEVLLMIRCQNQSLTSTAFQELNTQLAVINQRLAEERTLRKQAQDNYRKLEKVALELANEIEHRLRVEKQLTTVLDAIGQGIVQVDQSGQVVMANKALSSMFGYEAEELIGQSIDLLLPAELRHTHVQSRNNYMRAPVSRPMGGNRELSGRHKNGKLIPVEIGLNPVELDGSLHVVATVLDITERQRHQIELLLQTQALERSNQELNDFAYIASHDLKEPLRGISNYAGFLLEDYESRLEQDGKDMLLSLVRLSARMEQLISELLHYSRLGQTQLKIEEVDVNAVAADVIDNLTPRLTELGASCEAMENLPKVQADRGRLAEVLQNLVSNAMKYNDKPEKRIQIGSIKQSDQPVIFVRDNGIGIAPLYHDKIFRIFKRLHAHDQFHGGTGVGLTIVKKIIERHGGRIWLESVPGEGTTFFFTLSGTTASDHN